MFKTNWDTQQQLFPLKSSWKLVRWSHIGRVMAISKNRYSITIVHKDLYLDSSSVHDLFMSCWAFPLSCWTFPTIQVRVSDIIDTKTNLSIPEVCFVLSPVTAP